MQSWNYIEEPPDSPATSREGLIIPTRLNPLIQKINLKRKHEEEYASDSEERVEKTLKKHKGLK